MDRTTLTLGVPKGRIAKTTAARFQRVGTDICLAPEDSREMFLPTSRDDLQICSIRSKDVTLLLEARVLDMAIIGSDVLFEAIKVGFSQKIDLDFCRCRMSLIGLPNTPRNFHPGQRVKVATKYPRAARMYFQGFGVEAEIISLNGSTELAPVAGLAPYVIDIVSTGQTLASNNLIELDHVADVSTKALIAPHLFGERRARCVRYLQSIARTDEIPPHQAAEARVSAVLSHT